MIIRKLVFSIVFLLSSSVGSEVIAVKSTVQNVNDVGHQVKKEFSSKGNAKEINKIVDSNGKAYQKQDNENSQKLESKQSETSGGSPMYIIYHLFFLAFIIYLVKKSQRRMYNLSLRDYFAIRPVLESKNENDFIEYKGDSNTLEKLRKKYSNEGDNPCDKEKIDILKKYFEKSDKDSKSNYLQQLYKIGIVFMILAFMIGILMGLSFIGETNINWFLFRSVIIPLMIFIMIIIARLKLVRRKLSDIVDDVPDFYQWVLNKKNNWGWFQSIEKNIGRIDIKYKEDYHEVIKFFSRNELPKFGIAYAAGLLITTYLVLEFSKVEFTYPSTYPGDKSGLVQFFSLPWSDYFSNAVPTFINNVHQSDYEMALFMTMTIIYWILVPRIILSLYHSWKLHQEVFYSLLLNEKSKEFFELILTQAGSGFVQEKIKKEPDTNIDKITKIVKDDKVDARSEAPVENTGALTKLKQPEKEPDTNIDKITKVAVETTHSIIFWQKDEDTMNFENILKKLDDFKDKKNDIYSLGLFMEDEDYVYESINKLNGLVLIVIDSSVPPSGDFDDMIQEILKNENVKKIWVLPIKNEKILTKLDNNSNYNDWDHTIGTNIKNEKVRMYDER